MKIYCNIKVLKKFPNVIILLCCIKKFNKFILLYCNIVFRDEADILRMYRSDRTTFSKDEIFENIRLQKQIISTVRNQPWPLKRKLKTVRSVKEQA